VAVLPADCENTIDTIHRDGNVTDKSDIRVA
jgi:hypothetical protein